MKLRYLSNFFAVMRCSATPKEGGRLIEVVLFIGKVTIVDKALIAANDTSLCGAILVLFLESHPGHRAEISHMNRQQNLSR